MLALAEMVGVSRNRISSMEIGQLNPTAKLALVLYIALDKKFKELFYFDWQEKRFVLYCETEKFVYKRSFNYEHERENA